MNTASLQDNDLRELAEEVLEEVFKTSTVKEAEDIIFNMIPESNIVGREEKLERIYAAFGETFSRIKLKNNSGQLEEFAKYRQQKRLEESWSARFNQEKRVQRVHSTVVAEDVAIIKKGLLGLFEKKKGDPCWVGYKQVGMKKKVARWSPTVYLLMRQHSMMKCIRESMVRLTSSMLTHVLLVVRWCLVTKMSGAEYTHGRKSRQQTLVCNLMWVARQNPSLRVRWIKALCDLEYRKANLKKKNLNCRKRV